MYGNVLIAVSVILMWELLPSLPWSQGVAWVYRLGLMGMSVLAYGLAARFITGAWLRRRQELVDIQTLRILHNTLVQKMVVGAAILYGLGVYFLGWRELCGEFSGPMGEAFQGFLGISPFLACAMGVWGGSFPGSRISGKGLGEYVWAQAGLFLPALLPWFIVVASLDLLGLVAPGLKAKIEGESLWSLGVFLGLVLILAWVFPGMIIRLWRCPSLPPGPVRKELEAFFSANGFRYRDIRLWKTLPWGGSTAGVLGVIPRARYILLTPSLLDTLEREELQGVMAHEIGHIRYRHMVFYFFFMAGLAILMELSLRAAPVAIVAVWIAIEPLGAISLGNGQGGDSLLSHLGLLSIILLLGEALLYLRVGFGLFSRNFERQADLYAVELQGRPWPLIRSLEKLGGFHPLVRSAPSWHHYSIEERIRFLIQCFQRPRLIQDHHKKVRLLKGGYLLALATLVFLLWGWEGLNWDKTVRTMIQQQAVLKALQQDQADPRRWFVLGTLSLQRGDLELAFSALSRALELDPENREVINNLAWLHATAPDAPLRNPARALELALKAARLGPHEPQILDTLAEALFVNGYVEEAIYWEKRALELARGDKGHYLKQLDKYQKARIGSANPSSGNP